MNSLKKEVAVATMDHLIESDRQVVLEGLIAYNTAQGFVWEHRPINVLARSADGQIVGGLLGEVNLNWLFISALWVAEPFRSRGVGTALMRQAEDEAVRLRCIGIHLDTFSFQAKPFYERCGFSVFGELRGCPDGGTRYYLSKRLSGGSDEIPK